MKKSERVRVEKAEQDYEEWLRSELERLETERNGRLVKPRTDEFVQFADPVNHPSHYTSHPSGVECIQVTEHMNFCIGNATKYLWRADLKEDALEDLKKAKWYIEREISLRGSR